MPTLTFHAPAHVARAIRAAAMKRGQRVAQFLLTSAEAAAAAESEPGPICDLEKLAIDGMAFAALRASQDRARALGLDKMTPAQIRATIKVSRRERRTKR